MDISQHFSKRQLLLYTLPTMATMVFASIYGIVDGYFVSNYAGKTAFAAVNLIMPFIMVLGSLGFMMGAGGSAIVAKTYGEGNTELSQKYFSQFVLFTFVVGSILAIAGAIFMEPVARALGADDDMLALCVLYGRISMISLPMFMLQYAFQSFFSTAGKPKLGFVVTLCAGITNIILDILFVGILGWGVAGAAAATAISEFIGGMIPLIYFLTPNNSYLRLRKPSLDAKILGRACLNGSSEMVANVAMSIVGMVYNLQLMSILGQNGVAAYGTIMYVGMIFAAVYEGFCVGTSPLMSYQLGSHNQHEMRSLLRKCIAIVSLLGAMMLLLSELFAAPLASIFTSYDDELFKLTTHALQLYSIAFLFMGLAMYGSALFTSLGNGPISALISLLRTFVFEIGTVLLLPLLIGTDGIWLAVVVAECAAMLLSGIFLLWLGPHYGLLNSKRDG